jgi:tRNA-splicing ligase RtcB
LKVIPLGRDKHKERKELPREYNGISEVAKNAFNHLADYQIGTLGGGNHFIEIGTNNDGFINIVIHSGSRGVGHKIAEHYMKLAASESVDLESIGLEFDKKNEEWKSKNPENYEKSRNSYIVKNSKNKVDIEGHYGFDLDSESGQAYLNDLNEALQFALDNREMMINKIVGCMEKTVCGYVETDRFINRNHNHAEIDGEYVIHRKGATHADEGMLGVIPGNMKDGSFIVKGKGNADSMSSSSHGAGRVYSRKKAKELLSQDEFNETMKGIVTNHTMDTLDEAPKAYKNIFEVMELQSDLVEVLDRIVPVLNIKG